MASGWMTAWRLDTELKRFERRSQDGGANGTTWGDIVPSERRNANRGVERGHEGSGEENIISAVIHVETTPHFRAFRDFCAVDRWGPIEKDDRRQKENKKFLEAMQRKAPRANFCTFGAEKAHLAACTAALRKMTASIKEREDKVM